MSKFSRRTFIEQASAVSLCTLTGVANAKTVDDLFLKETSRSIFPAGFPGRWASFGRLTLQRSADSVTLQDGFAVASETWKDREFRFRARAPRGTEEVQIWAGVRCVDQGRRYVFALRGGNNDDIYLARYAPDGGIKFLGIAPLDFHPVPETWYRLRAIVRGNRFQLYLNDEALPRINVVDDGALWGAGSVSLGGGWLPVEFCNVQARPLTEADIVSLDAIGDRVWVPHPGSLDRESLRAKRRVEYRAASIAAFDRPRMEISLDGKWLFLPEQDQQAGVVPHAQECDDATWHLMDVPDFWKPTVTWLYGETGFPYLRDVSAMKGISDKFYLEEIKRLDSYTFDWRNTRGAWYRHYVDLPSDISERRFELCFDAIAKVSDVWVNGVHIASHTGMFGEVKQDVTSAIKPGRNVITVHAVGQIEEPKASDEVLGVAVTVEVTASMLNSLPHGMYHDVGGIWQPVKLIVTGPVRVDEVYIQPRLDGLNCDVTVDGNTSELRQPLLISYSIRSVKDKTLLYSLPQDKSIRIGIPDRDARFSASGLAPELWSPQEPNLYDLEITLTSAGRILDRHITRFGFRTFTTEKEKLLLNGKPFWLRGANHFPHALRPNDGTLARRFMKLAKDGNIVATRSHTAPFSKTWLDAADEVGMAVSFEGTWPWLMLRGAPPSEDLIREWQEEFISLIRKYRNHPSIILWTVNNEMKFASSDQKQPEQLRQKWEILTRAIEAMRTADPSRPVVCDSSYCRKEVQKEYDTLIRPNGFDDGDIDDAHMYPGWYGPSFFHYFHGEFGKARSYADRPLISQEMSTGYPRNDDGHPARFYLFKHYTPQSLVGDEAYENRNPAIFLKRQALLTKELAEAIRRTNRSECSGIFHFAYLTWFKDVWNSDSIRPFETYHALRSALQPVLISAELYGRHFYAGSRLRMRVCIVNDAENVLPLPPSQVGWEIKAGSEVIAADFSQVAQVPYYSNQWIELSIPIPATLPSSRVDATLRLFLKANDIQYCDNSYDIVIATAEWASGDAWSRAILIDPTNAVARSMQNDHLRARSSLRGLKQSDVAVLADAEEILQVPDNVTLLKQFVNDGGRALLLKTGERLVQLFPDQVKSFRLYRGEIAAMHIPEASAFDGLQPLDLAWWELGGGAIPQVCRGSYQIDNGRSDVRAIADAIDFHGYLNGPADFAKISGSPLVEIRMGKGRIVASEMMLLEASQSDPIAKKLFGNLVQMLSDKAEIASRSGVMRE
jgi:hypothetical protein